MILRRLGNKKKLAKKIIQFFPNHKIYIEPFFGAGGIFFNKPKAKYNILNDIDGDVFNLFHVILNRGEEFLKIFEITPYSSELFKYWEKNKETDPVRKAVRFVYLSNYGYFGKGYGAILGAINSKQITIHNYQKTLDFLKDCSLQFANYDFRKFLKSINFIRLRNKKQTFIYCDPPYLGTGNNYSHSFTEQYFTDLLDILIDSGCMFAISEFDNEFVIKQAKERGLNVIVIGERKNIRNNRTEILINNYSTKLTLFD